jgi:hypothetical protein
MTAIVVPIGDIGFAKLTVTILFYIQLTIKEIEKQAQTFFWGSVLDRYFLFSVMHTA